MTKLNTEELNEAGLRTCIDVIKQVEDGLLTDEQLLGELYGRLVAAQTLGWDISLLVEAAQNACGRLIKAIEAFEATEVEV